MTLDDPCGVNGVLFLFFVKHIVCCHGLGSSTGIGVAETIFAMNDLIFNIGA